MNEVTKEEALSWAAILSPYGFKPPSRASWLTGGHVRHLYFIERDELVKVGVSADVQQRLHSLRAGHPRGLYLRGSIELPAVLAFQTERRVHLLLKDKAVGREWFRMRAREAKAIAAPICSLAWVAAKRLGESGFWGGHDRELAIQMLLEGKKLPRRVK